MESRDTALLVDYNKVINDKLLPRLKPHPVPPKGANLSLVLILDQEDIDKIKNEKDISLKDTNINDHYYVMYDKREKTCVLPCLAYENARPVLQALFAGFPRDTTLWVGVEIDVESFTERIGSWCDQGFCHPYICDKNPLKESLKPSIGLVRHNTPSESYDSVSTQHEVLYVLEQYESGRKSCSINIKLSPQARSFLKKASKIGIVMDKNGKETQKELGGELNVGKVKKINGKIVYVIDLDEGSVSSGEDENIEIDASRYNFHSHPEQAYIKHNVQRASPSMTDYLGFLQLGNNTIFHCVATLEGAYIMSFGEYWCNHLNKVSKSFIKKHYDISHAEKITPYQYCNRVNDFRYKGHPIFHVQFMPWNQAGKIFSVDYKKTGMSCLPSEKSYRKHSPRK